MNIARQIAKYEEKGFARDKAEINTLIENAVFTIFQEFPDAFVLFGGATLVLFHESVRHSADVDLLIRGDALPTQEQIIATLKRDLAPVARLLQLGELRFATAGRSMSEGSIFVTSTSGRMLFRVDLTRFGSAIESEMETHAMEAPSGESVWIKSPTKELLLLQKAEAFLLRRIVKARDGYDIHVLLEKGAVLTPVLRAQLADAIRANEMDREAILERVEMMDEELCSLELGTVLPPEVYSPLEKGKFGALRRALMTLYEEWL